MSLLQLPVEIFETILHYVPFHGLVSLRLTSTYCRGAVEFSGLITGMLVLGLSLNEADALIRLGKVGETDDASSTSTYVITMDKVKTHQKCFLSCWLSCIRDLKVQSLDDSSDEYEIDSEKWGNGVRTFIEIGNRQTLLIESSLDFIRKLFSTSEIGKVRIKSLKIIQPLKSEHKNFPSVIEKINNLGFDSSIDLKIRNSTPSISTETILLNKKFSKLSLDINGGDAGSYDRITFEDGSRLKELMFSGTVLLEGKRGQICLKNFATFLSKCENLKEMTLIDLNFVGPLCEFPNCETLILYDCSEKLYPTTGYPRGISYAKDLHLDGSSVPWVKKFDWPNLETLKVSVDLSESTAHLEPILHSVKTLLLSSEQWESLDILTTKGFQFSKIETLKVETSSKNFHGSHMNGIKNLKNLKILNIKIHKRNFSFTFLKKDILVSQRDSFVGEILRNCKFLEEIVLMFYPGPSDSLISEDPQMSINLQGDKLKLYKCNLAY